MTVYCPFCGKGAFGPGSKGKGLPPGKFAHGLSNEVLSTSVRIRELTIERPAIAAYLKHIAPDKLEIALVHALDVGVTELVARRERFRK